MIMMISNLKAIVNEQIYAACLTNMLSYTSLARTCSLHRWVFQLTYARCGQVPESRKSEMLFDDYHKNVMLGHKFLKISLFFISCLLSRVPFMTGQFLYVPLDVSVWCDR